MSFNLTDLFSEFEFLQVLVFFLFDILCVFVWLRNSARFLWKSIPPAAKEARPEIVAVWRIGQRLWTRNYAGVHEAVRGFDWGADIVDFVNAFSG